MVESLNSKPGSKTAEVIQQHPECGCIVSVRILLASPGETLILPSLIIIIVRSILRPCGCGHMLSPPVNVHLENKAK